MSFLVTRQRTLENPFGPPRKVKELHEKRAAPMGYDYLGPIAGLLVSHLGRIVWPQVQDYLDPMPQDLLVSRTRPRSGRASARSTGLHPSRGGGFLANERHHGVEPRPLVRPPKPQSSVHG